jgi:hypothetical protein
MMLESKIESAVCDYARNKQFLAYKFTSPNRMAVPDRLFITPFGEVFFIEFKATGKAPTVPQMREHERIRHQGIEVFVVDTVELGKAVIDEYANA